MSVEKRQPVGIMPRGEMLAELAGSLARHSELANEAGMQFLMECDNETLRRWVSRGRNFERLGRRVWHER